VNNTLGIDISNSTNNFVLENNITANHMGIYLYYSSYNKIVGNRIAKNELGIILDLSSSNSIYHNNFIDNSEVITSDSINVWDDGYPSGGNYWSDYSSTDLFSGLYQNETGSDGIGDTAYTTESVSRDKYPLIGMFSDFSATSEYYVEILCNSSISDFQFNGTAISFNVAGENGTLGFCRIRIPTALLNGTYKVFVKGTEILYTLLPFSTSAHSYLYFTYSHSIKRVTVIPEFPSILILPLFMLATLLTVIVYRRRHASYLKQKNSEISLIS